MTRFSRPGLISFDYSSYSHSGLNFREDDHKFIVDLAFETDNPDLWIIFMAGHQYHQKLQARGTDNLRRHMREQALEKPLFMREWAKTNRAMAQRFRRDHYKWRIRHTRKIKRRRKKQDEIRTANIKYVQDNREVVEAGRHWDCLIRFAELVLTAPDKIEQEFGDEALVRNALKKCLDFIAPYVPDLSELAKLQCASQILHSEKISLCGLLRDYAC